jgi:hypothetical protein
MKRFAFFVAAAPALALGCAPTAQGGADAGAGASPGSSTAELRATRAPSCHACGAALDEGASGALCKPSQAVLDALLACVCDTTCSSVCGGAPGNCLSAWDGNPPLACKTCLASSTGCGEAWQTCLDDDGHSRPPHGPSSPGGGGCTCDPALPLCPGGGSCSTPGPFDAPGNAACGSAEYCALCCDPGDACTVQGTCKITGIAQTPCAANHECCSGVCTNGACDGGCGLVVSF